MTVSYRITMTDSWQYLSYLATKTITGRCFLACVLASPLLGLFMALYQDGTLYRAAHGLRLSHWVWPVFWLAVGSTYIFGSLSIWLGLYLGTLIAPTRTVIIAPDFCRMKTFMNMQPQWKRFSSIVEYPNYFYFVGWAQIVQIPKRAFDNSAEAYMFFDTALTYWRASKGIAPPPVPDTSGVWPPAPRVNGFWEPGGKP